MAGKGPGNPGWPKGTSGNPAGRPKDTPEMAEAKVMARSKSLDAVKRLVELMASNDERIALMACESILDRALGKAAQAIQLSGDLTVRDAHELTEEELERIAAGGSAGIAGPTTGAKDDAGLH